jgi:nucleotide-binding universal stress UspA family protein
MKILIPTDFSVLPEHAWILIQRMMMGKNIDVTFLHVMQVPETVTLDGQKNFNTCGEIDVNYLLSQRSMIEKKLAGIALEHPEAKTEWVAGKLTDSIVGYAENNDFDLIAMATHGAFGISEAVSGTNTQVVARKSQIPVLSLMCDRSDWTLKNVLFVNDFSIPFDMNLHWLETMMDAEHSNMHFLHVVNGIGVDENTVHFNMKNYADRMGWKGTQFHTIQDTKIEDGVIHFNQKNDMDLVIIGTYGKKGLFKTNDAEKLINHMYKPLITFHLN